MSKAVLLWNHKFKSVVINLYSLPYLIFKERNITFKCRHTSNEAMCVTKCWLYSHLVLKNKLQAIPKREKPVSLIDMVPRVFEWWRNKMGWWMLETNIQWNPRIYDSPTNASLPQFDSHSPVSTKNMVKDKR